MMVRLLIVAALLAEVCTARPLYCLRPAGCDMPAEACCRARASEPEPSSCCAASGSEEEDEAQPEPTVCCCPAQSLPKEPPAPPSVAPAREVGPRVAPAARPPVSPQPLVVLAELPADLEPATHNVWHARRSIWLK